MSTEKQNNYRVIGIEVDHIKRLRAIDMTPPDDLVIVAGDNAQGKTSLLDSIEMALNGGRSIPKEPVHRGEKSGRIKVKIGGSEVEFTVTRKFSPKGTTLEVRLANGDKVEQPQTFLDGFIGALTFDPLEFATMKDRAQAELLMDLTGIRANLTALDDERKRVFDERTVTNRMLDAKRGALSQMVVPKDDCPTERVDTAVLLSQKNELQRQITENAAKRSALIRLEDAWGRTSEDLDELRKQIEEKEALYDKQKADVMVMRADVDGLKDPSTAGIDAELAMAAETNAHVDNAVRFGALAKEVEEVEEQSRQMTERLSDIDDAKRNALAAAKFPVEGLGFDESGVMFNDIPFSQISHAEQVRVSMAMGAAMNPKLKMILIRNGSLMDEKSKGLVRAYARAHGFQVWLEVVGKPKDAAIVIEDGVCATESEATS